jgi:hypothetical protein
MSPSGLVHGVLDEPHLQFPMLHPGSGDAVARQPGWERDQPTIRSHGHDQIVAIARQVDLGA